MDKEFKLIPSLLKSIKPKYLKADNIPYQTYMERGWFKVTEKIKNTAYGDKLYAVTLVTPKGQVAIVGLVKDKYIA